MILVSIPQHDVFSALVAFSLVCVQVQEWVPSTLLSRLDTIPTTVAPPSGYEISSFLLRRGQGSH